MQYNVAILNHINKTTMKTKQSNNSVAATDAVKIANQRALFNLEWENDTVFKKRELNYKTKAAFQKDLEAGKISKYTTVFIKDSKEIYKNGQYYGAGSSGGEIPDVIINIDSLDSTTGTLSGITYNEIVDCIKKNGSIKVRMNIDGMNFIFASTSCMYLEESNKVLISIDASLTSSNMHTQNLTFLISNDNSYVTLIVNKIIVNGSSKNDGDISITLSYNKDDGQTINTDITLKKTGDGTKALTDNGKYAEFATPTKVVNGSSGTVTQELSPNKYYKFSECISLTITLGAEIPGILNEYMFEFASGSKATVLKLPETVKWNNGDVPTIETNKRYIVSIVSNIAVIGGV